MIDWLVRWASRWLKEWVAKWLNRCVICSIRIERMRAWVSEKKNGWKGGWLSGCVDEQMVEKGIYIDKTSLGEPPAHAGPTSGRRPPEAGRQNFERIPAAIKGRKKPFANRIREFDIQRGLKRVKNEFIFTKRISENLRRTSAGSRTAISLDQKTRCDSVSR